MALYPHLLLDLDSKTGSYVAKYNENIVFKSSSSLEVFEWAKCKANVLTLGKRFQTPCLKRRHYKPLFKEVHSREKIVS